jgi:hypothetical protein
MTTPAQASGHPNFIVDVPIQGPTDEGIRAADCWYRQNMLPARPACVDCEGPIPMWAQSKGLLGSRVSFGGRGALGFALAAPSDPDIWDKLTADQQKWVADTLAKLNNLIVSTTGTTCPQWAPTIHQAGFCFQAWFNGAKLGFTKADGSPLILRTDGMFDQDTLDALRTTVALNPKDFTTPFPGTTLPGLVKEEKKGLSTGAMVGLAAGGAAVLGGIIYVATRKKR